MKPRDSFKPAVNKLVLLVFAGLFYLVIGCFLVYMAITWWGEAKRIDHAYYVCSGVLLGLLIHHFGFLRIVDKNLKRILPEDGKKCIFGFIPWQSYVLIPVMITLGYLLRHSPIPRHYTAIIYSGIGLALVLSSIRYIRYFIMGLRKDI